MPATSKKMIEAQNQNNARVRLRRILFATDFSTASKLAMPFAAKLADRVGARLFVMNVQEPVNYALPPESWKGLDIAREQELETIVQDIHRERPGLLPPQILKGEGIVWSEVADAVKKNEIDLVVIGTHGRTGLGKFLLGSQAEEILRHSSVPVYIIGPNVGEPKSQLGYMRSIIFATDFGPASLTASQYAVSMAEEFATRLAVVHVFGKNHAGDFATQRNVSDCEHKMEVMLPREANFWCDPTFVVEHGEPWEKIIEVAEKKGANLIVLGAYASSAATGTARNTVHNVIAHAPCPVLTVPAQN